LERIVSQSIRIGHFRHLVSTSCGRPRPRDQACNSSLTTLYLGLYYYSFLFVCFLNVVTNIISYDSVHRYVEVTEQVVSFCNNLLVGPPY